MTNAEKLITHIQIRLAQKSYTVLSWELELLDKMLKAFPSYEEDKVYDIICADDEVPIVPEANAMYRTFDSDTLHVGDVVDKDGTVGIVTMVYFDDCYVMYSNGSHEFDRISNFQRTGRNFPAIENILKIIAKEKTNEP